MGQLRKAQLLVESLILYSILTATATRGQTNSSTEGFVSIDCGTTQSYIDPFTGLEWAPDTKYISHGENYASVTGTENLNPSHSYASSLRYFPKPQPKYCYELPGTTPKALYLIRHSYWYSPIPGIPTPESFVIGLDSAPGSIVVKPVGFLMPLQFEFLYKAQGNSISFCLYRDATNSTPFISALELRPANPLAYQSSELDNGGYIICPYRFNLGAMPAGIVRFPDDDYDRIWLGWLDSSAVLSTVSKVNPNGLALAPPSKVMETAQSSVFLGPVSFLSSILSVAVSTPMILHLYFAEISATSSATSRSFTIHLAGFPPEPCNPFVDGGGPLRSSVKRFFNWTPESTGISMFPTTTAVEPPLLNAFELCHSFKMAKNTTEAADVSAIDDIKRAFGLTLSSVGDPCLPAPHSWILCSFGPSFRVTSIDLSNHNLTGVIPAALGSLSALRFLSLNHNALTGPIPDLSRLTVLETAHFENNALNGTIPDTIGSSTLRELYLQNNRFVGKVPDNLKRPSLKLDVSGNPGLNDPSVYTGPSASPSGLDPVDPSSVRGGNVNRALIGGVVGGGFAMLVLILCLVVFIWRYRKSHASSGSNTVPQKQPEQMIGKGLYAKKFTLEEMIKATENFLDSRKIGGGGFGPVYYGTLPNGLEVAIKDRRQSSQQGPREFVNEVTLLSRIRHRNLISLLGYCEEGNRQMLVYEYAHKGALQEHLYGRGMRRNNPLNWTQRLNIALEAANGLEYLHHGCNPEILHRDIKSGNILLTSDYTAKVADLGISQLIGEATNDASSAVKITIGYGDPEAIVKNKFTTKSDVYSFGVVLLEIICARPPTNPDEDREPLVRWVRDCMQHGKLEDVLDPALAASHPNMESVWHVADTALRCVEPIGLHRPTMSDVIRFLHEAVQMCAQPTSSQSRLGSAAYYNERTPSQPTSTNSGTRGPSQHDSN